MKQKVLLVIYFNYPNCMKNISIKTRDFVCINYVHAILTLNEWFRIMLNKWTHRDKSVNRTPINAVT